MKVICISTFDNVGQIKNLTFNKKYECKFYLNGNILIIGDDKKPKFVSRLNFVTYKNI